MDMCIDDANWLYELRSHAGYYEIIHEDGAAGPTLAACEARAA